MLCGMLEQKTGETLIQCGIWFMIMDPCFPFVLTNSPW